MFQYKAGDSKDLFDLTANDLKGFDLSLMLLELGQMKHFLNTCIFKHLCDILSNTDSDF
ncbi:MAG: hypothetical protein ACLSCV_10420 [Acutalibacteraceae bacterium]